MTSFLDGPAKGQVFALHRAPVYLRVVVSAAGKWDALNLLEDKAAPDETIYAYLMKGKPRGCFVRAGRGQGGYRVIATYQFIEQQPADEILRDNERWTQWVQEQPKQCVAE